MFAQELLALTQFASTGVIYTELCHNTINNHYTKVAGRELLNQIEDSVVLMLN